MPELIDRAIASHLQKSGQDYLDEARMQASAETRLSFKKQPLARAALEVFDAATHPNFGRLVGSLATSGSIRPYNQGKIITYHGPFAVEYRVVGDEQVTAIKQLRVYDFRNGAKKQGNPTLHIEAGVRNGAVMAPDIKIPGTHILSDIEIGRQNPAESIIKVRGDADGYSASVLLEDPNSPAWEEVFDDLALAKRFLESGVVTKSHWLNGRLVSVD